MKVALHSVFFLAALLGILSFIFLAVATGTDFWYVIDAPELERLDNRTARWSSHSGMWRTCGGNNTCFPSRNPFQERTNITSSHRRALTMRGASVILLPLSLILMIFGGIVGFLSILAQLPLCLLVTGLLFLFGALLTLAGVSLYMAYSMAGFKEILFLLSRREQLRTFRIQFSWSLALAWLSFATEVATGLAFLLAAWMVHHQQRRDHSI